MIIAIILVVDSLSIMFMLQRQRSAALRLIRTCNVKLFEFGVASQYLKFSFAFSDVVVSALSLMLVTRKL
jgi:hypothetical protein